MQSPAHLTMLIFLARGNATGRFDLRGAQGQTSDMSSIDIDKASLQEVVDKLSVMVLSLHSEVRHLRDEQAQMNSERSAKQPDLKASAESSTEADSDGSPLERVTSASTAGKPQAANHCLCA
jgi:hypothetical protein